MAVVWGFRSLVESTVSTIVIDVVVHPGIYPLCPLEIYFREFIVNFVCAIEYVGCWWLQGFSLFSNHFFPYRACGEFVAKWWKVLKFDSTEPCDSRQGYPISGRVSERRCAQCIHYLTIISVHLEAVQFVLILVCLLQDSRLSLTVLRILRTPVQSSSESSSEASFDMWDDASHDATPNERFEMKIRRGFRKLSSPHVDPSGIEVHAKWTRN